MEQFNCTTPYGRIKENICTNVTLAKRALELYFDLKKFKNNTCDKSCFSLALSGLESTDLEIGSSTQSVATFSFKENVKVITAFYLYSDLSLLAEIGGYVGLFLGVSVNQVSGLLEVILLKFRAVV